MKKRFNKSVNCFEFFFFFFFEEMISYKVYCFLPKNLRELRNYITLGISSLQKYCTATFIFKMFLYFSVFVLATKRKERFKVLTIS